MATHMKYKFLQQILTKTLFENLFGLRLHFKTHGIPGSTRSGVPKHLLCLASIYTNGCVTFFNMEGYSLNDLHGEHVKLKIFSGDHFFASPK